MSELKYCPSCSQNKLLSEFTKSLHNKDGLSFYCKQCKSEQNQKCYLKLKKKQEENKWYIKKKKKLYNKIKIDEIRQYINDIKSSGCCICKEKERCCLEFHHINPKEKKFEIHEYQYYSDEDLKSELQKCILVCKNCHRKIHSNIITI